MIFQVETKDRKIQVLLDHIGIQPVILTVFKYWSVCFYPYQNMTLYGAIFQKFPHLKSSN